MDEDDCGENEEEGNEVAERSRSELPDLAE